LQVADALMFGAGYAAFGGRASLHNNQGHARIFSIGNKVANSSKKGTCGKQIKQPCVANLWNMFSFLYAHLV